MDRKQPSLLNEIKNKKGQDIDTVIDALEESDKVLGGSPRLRGMLASQFQTAQNALRYMSLDWDEFEDLLFVQSRTPDNAKIRLSEGSLSTIVIERAGRVMSNLPGGSVQALGLQNQGKGQLMDLILEKHIYPNANYQYDLETKLFMWDMYSNVYGTMPMCYDWTYTKNYVGPDCWLVPIRNFFPQQGRFSMHNCDYVFISNTSSSTIRRVKSITSASQLILHSNSSITGTGTVEVTRCFPRGVPIPLGDRDGLSASVASGVMTVNLGIPSTNAARCGSCSSYISSTRASKIGRAHV